MNKESLEKEGKNNPIKLEYYKVENEEDIDMYGIEIIKTEYNSESVNVEKANINLITSDENIINEILEKLKEYQVTPIVAGDIIEDLIKENA